MSAWLGAVSIHSRDFNAGAQNSLVALLDIYPVLQVIVNHFDDDAGGSHGRRGSSSASSSSTARGSISSNAAPARLHARLEVSFVPGMKTLFWKQVLTREELTRRKVLVLWLFDADVYTHPAVMPLGELVSALLSSDASALQPVVRAAGMGVSHTWLRQRPALSSCVASTARFVEVMTPLLRADAWTAFHERYLSAVPDAALAVSDFGVDVTWCAAFARAFPARPACLVLYSAAAVHGNTNSMHRRMNASVYKQGRMCAETCRVLKRFRSEWMNYSHDTQDCWMATATGLAPAHGPRYIDTHGAWKAGRRAKDGSVLTATGKRWVPGTLGEGT